MAADELSPERPSTEVELAEAAPEFFPWVGQGGHFVQVRPLCPCGYREQVDGGVGLCDRCSADHPVDELASQRAKQLIRAQHIQQWRADLAVGLWHSMTDSPRSTRLTP